MTSVFYSVEIRSAFVTCAIISCEVGLPNSNKDSSLIINAASFKKCLGQAGLSGCLPPCVETLAGEELNTTHLNTHCAP